MVWKLVRIVAVNVFYFMVLSFIIFAMVVTAFRGNLLGVLALFFFFPVITALCHEMHGCDNGMICRISKLFWRLNLWCCRG